jgi:integrase/recombinase XerD
MFIPEYRQCLRGSVLGKITDNFVAYLQCHDYTPPTVRAYLHGIEHFARWVSARRIELCDFNEILTERFVTKHLPVCRCPDPCQRGITAVRPALDHLLHVLRAGGLTAKPQLFPAAVEEELLRLDNHLHAVCGLSCGTRISRRQWVGRFLKSHFSLGPVDIGRLQPCDIIQFMTRSMELYRPGTLNVLGSALRSYFRFRAVMFGDNVKSLLAAVPCAASWRLDTVPKHLTAEEISRFLGAFDPHCPMGLRDYAMARCLLDMGLRAGEVAALQLDDLNWRDGTLAIPGGKGRRTDVLPLLADTGQALVEYLQAGRPVSASRAVFVRHQAPLDLPVTAEMVRGAIRRAFLRCGLKGYNGTHVLRHTAAVQMRCGGATLKEIADVLRHRSLDTTMIYSKVDLPHLAAVAAPWPGGVA